MITRREMLAGLAGATGALAGLPGCHRARTASARRQVLRYPIAVEPTTLDPALLPDLFTWELLQNVYEGLVTFDAANRVAGALAEKWEISPDGKVYTFHLRPNARFHTGRPVTAADVKYSLERSLWPETKSPVAANYLDGIVGVKEVAAGKRRDLPGVTAPDDHTVVLALDRPRGYFLGALAYPTGWVVCREAIEKNGGRADEHASIGTGPFRLEEYRHGAKVVLAGFHDYWGGSPPLERIERPVVLDYQTAHLMFENGEIDLCQTALSDYVTDQGNARLKAQSRLVPQASVIYVAFQQRLQPAFRDRRVRRAFALAIDREAVARIAYKAACPAAYSFLPAGLPGADPTMRALACDPVAARKLLAEAGFPGGAGFPALRLVTMEKEPQYSAAMQVVRDNLKLNLGITVDTQEQEAATFIADTGDNERIPFFLSGWFADYLDPQDFLSTLLRTGAPLNHLGYRNPAFDALCDRADAASDMAARIPLYRQADRIAMEDAAVIPLVNAAQPLLVSPRVRGLQYNLSAFVMAHYATRIA